MQCDNSHNISKYCAIEGRKGVPDSASTGWEGGGKVREVFTGEMKYELQL